MQAPGNLQFMHLLGCSMIEQNKIKTRGPIKNHISAIGGVKMAIMTKKSFGTFLDGIEEKRFEKLSTPAH